MGAVATTEHPPVVPAVTESTLSHPADAPLPAWRAVHRALGYRGLQRVLTALVSGAFLLMLLAGQYFSPASSDSVAQQNILRSILDGQPSNLVVPVDNWLLHLPIYLLTSLLPSGALAHLLDVLLTNAVLLVGLLVFTRTYVHRLFPASRLALIVGHLTAAWFLGLAVYIPRSKPVAPLGNDAAVGAFLTPNHRNMETGIALLLLAWFAWWAGRPAARARGKQVALWLAASASLGALIYSDPFFLYTLGGSLGLTAVVFWLTSRWSARRAAGLLSVLVGAVAVHSAVSVVMKAVGIHAITAVESQFAPVDTLVSNLQKVFGAYCVMFRAAPWGLPIKASVALVLLNAVLAASVVAGLVSAVRSQFRTPDPVRLPAAIFVVIGVAAYGLSTLAASGPASFRYIFTPVLVALPFATGSIVRLARLAPKSRHVVLVVLCAGLLANVAVNASALVRQAPLGTDRLYADNDTLIRAVEKAGYTKGYATFWNANINTYLSGRKVLFLPITSLGDRAARYDFLINTPDFDARASSTFLYVAPGVDEYRAHDQAIAFWTKAVGEPDGTEQLPTGGTLLFYNRDIGPELPLWVPVAQD